MTPKLSMIAGDGHLFGKTRTVIAFCDVLGRFGVKNIFSLPTVIPVTAALLCQPAPDLSVTNLCEEKDNYNAHCVFNLSDHVIRTDSVMMMR